MQPSSGASSQGSETDDYDAHHVYDDRDEEVEVEDDTPNGELQTLTAKEQAAFTAAHQQMVMVGYENVTHQEQCDLIKIGTFATEPSIPSDRKAIDSRIVFKVKYRANGHIVSSPTKSTEVGGVESSVWSGSSPAREHRSRRAFARRELLWARLRLYPNPPGPNRRSLDTKPPA